MLRYAFCSVVVLSFAAGQYATQSSVAEEHLECDLLVVGGTESGCAAAVQAARMGVPKIILVNDIEWLGGQFSAEGLGAIDENRAHGYDGTVPIPRSGIFRDIIDRIEARNATLYGGVKRPGNTRVITTVRPVIAEEAFRALLEPYEASGQLQHISRFHVDRALMDGERVIGVALVADDDPTRLLHVRAKLTIDATDWGDVVQASGAAFDTGIDAKEKYQEPSAPPAADPATDLNPITWCMILEEQASPAMIEMPERYDEASFMGTWGWIDETFAYTTRRLVDGNGNEAIDAPDLLLINNPNIDYPLDIYPAHVAEALEATEQGASQRSIVELSREQRDIIYHDARNRSLQYLFFLQSRYPKFRSLALSREFGTANHLPPKPYIRESLRLVAQYIVKEQDVLGAGDRSNYANAMFPDALFSWQFELDFHPTARKWLTDRAERGAWEADFRGNRRFGNGGTGRALFPLRGFVPAKIDGLLGAQKNLGYSSIVGSSCRLHDQSTIAGQACGAVAAASLALRSPPRELWHNAEALRTIWSALLSQEHGAPVVIWPFADVDPYDDGFVAIQQLALRRAFPLEVDETSFEAELPVANQWFQQVTQRLRSRGYEIDTSQRDSVETRRDAAVLLWGQIENQTPQPFVRKHPHDADDDGIRDHVDPLPFQTGTTSWNLDLVARRADRDGVPDEAMLNATGTEAFNFTSNDAKSPDGFKVDVGTKYSADHGFGWLADLTANTRLRESDANELRAGFVFTRGEDVWQKALPAGEYRITVCIGDSEYAQPGQFVIAEDTRLAENLSTYRSSFRELSTEVSVRDGHLTLRIGNPKGGSNTALNWLLITPIDR